MSTSDGSSDLSFENRRGVLGPGLITGAADDDPSGIVTYSQAGAVAGYGLLWTSLVTLPLMIGVQLMSSRVGMVSGMGFAAVIGRWYSRWMLWSACALLIAANVVNIGADLNGMAAALALLTGLPARASILPLAILILVAMVCFSYSQLARVLRWLALSLLAYIITAFVAAPAWREVGRGLIPSLPHTHGEVLLIVALFGTTISPYLFFWEAAEEVEEEIDMGRSTPASRLGASPGELRDARTDVVTGMTFSNMIAFFIILTTGATLHRAGITNIETAEQAAMALRPLAGSAASVLFAVGVLATGMLAVPVLAGSAAYAIADAARWKAGMSERPATAPQFYAVLGLMVLGGCALNIVSVSAVRMLVIAAVANGVLAPPLIVILLVISNDRRVMGDHVNGIALNVAGVLAALLMSGAALMLLLPA
jgi:NRAMP (natural resistance-associated macrophage protein)-like metal ion transporter